MKITWQKIKRILEPELSIPDWLPVPSHITYVAKNSKTAMLILWIYAYYVRFLTIPGRLVLAVSLLITFYSMVLLHTPVLILTFTLFGIFITDIIIGFLFRPKLKVKRRLPSRVRADSIIDVVYELSNRRFFPTWNITMDFFYSRHGLSYTKDPAYVDYIPGKQTVTISTQVKSGKRGEYELPLPRAESSYPFGIFKWSCRIKDKQNLLVYPKFEPLTSFSLPVGKKYQRQGNAMVSKIGESLDIHGCRDFRFGDDPRHIHWPSTARTGELIVKEYQEEFLSRIALVLDTHIAPPKWYKRLLSIIPDQYPQLEAGISLTAAITDFLTKGDLVVDIFAAGPDIYHFQGGRHVAHMDSILDILACLEPNFKEPLIELEPAVMQEIAAIGSAVVILLEWNDARKAFIEQLKSHGVVTKVLVISNNKDLDLNYQAERLEPDDITTGKVNVL